MVSEMCPGLIDRRHGARQTRSRVVVLFTLAEIAAFQPKKKPPAANGGGRFKMGTKP
jgi:hypothetical protein